MKIFISWSGDKSREVAEFLTEWLKLVIQASDPWISTEDIYKGTAWFAEIAQNLSIARTGIICITNENKNKPWLIFEAGALANKFGERVHPLLIDITKTEDPLNQFNHTLPNEKDIKKLIVSLNSLLDIPMKKNILDTVFDTYWPQFEKKFEEINEKYKNTKIEKHPVKKSDEDKFDEILSGLRSLDRRMREIEIDRRDAYRNNKIFEPSRHAPMEYISEFSDRSAIEVLTDSIIMNYIDGIRPISGIISELRRFGVNDKEIKRITSKENIERVKLERKMQE